MSAREQAIMMGKGPGGEPTVVAVNDDGIFLDVGTPVRAPLHATITANGTAKQLSTATGDGDKLSQAGWILIVPGGGASVRLGTATVTASTQLRIVAPASSSDQTKWVIPSSSLAGFYVISEGADVAVELSGAQDV
jgi:hypothetical protein